MSAGETPVDRILTRALATRRLAPALLLAAAAAATLAFLIAPAPATAGQGCADQIVGDWYEDGRVDRLFPLQCYLDAISSLPVDVLDYSNAREDILRALAYAKRGKPDPGDADSKGGKGGATAGGSDPTGVDPTGAGTGEGTQEVAGGTIDTSGPSALPVPLILLGALALLLLAAGGVGYLKRRRSARAGDGEL
ncbi:MAG: hypothetical protein EXQ81_02305 [Thermoleophilia bacterium]|nr:hypothetical protein [Thermoleophilia bacterium]